MRNQTVLPFLNIQSFKVVCSKSSPMFSECGRAQQKVKHHISWMQRQIKPSGLLIFSISPLLLTCFWFSSCMCLAFHIVSTHIPHSGKEKHTNKSLLEQSRFWIKILHTSGVKVLNSSICYYVLVVFTLHQAGITVHASRGCCNTTAIPATIASTTTKIELWSRLCDCVYLLKKLQESLQ